MDKEAVVEEGEGEEEGLGEGEGVQVVEKECLTLRNAASNANLQRSS